MSLPQMERFVLFQKDSGPIDFAYEIHTKIGEKATGAKVNGRMVPLTTKLKTGDQVEIITNPNSFGPSRDWLNIVKTSKARNKIRQFFKNQDKELSIQPWTRVAHGSIP